MDKERKRYVIGRIIFNQRDIVDRLKSINGILHDLMPKEREEIIDSLGKDVYALSIGKELVKAMKENELLNKGG